MVIGFSVFLLLLFLGVLFAAYQYKNPYLLIFGGIVALLFGLMAYQGSLLEDCQPVTTTSSTDGNSTSYTSAAYCYNTITLPFSQVVFGTVFVLFAVYLFFQAGLGILKQE